jgi:hypothetical protein
MTKKQKSIKRLLTAAMILMAAAPLLAQAGAGGISAASETLKSYVPAIKTLVQAIGAVVGLVGGIRIYNKWNNGDQDVNKEIMGWGGACIFLIVMPEVISGFFG